jgi:hypothetical protein
MLGALPAAAAQARAGLLPVDGVARVARWAARRPATRAGGGAAHARGGAAGESAATTSLARAIWASVAQT